MRGFSFIKSKLLRGARRSYNSGNYRRSSLQSRFIHSLFRDRESLDILARSYLRRKNFVAAAKAYNKANIRGYSLLDHNENQFKSELGAENYIGAFRAILSIKGKTNRKKSVSELAKKLTKLTDTERVEVIQNMNKIDSLPLEITELLPWAPKKVLIEESDNNYTKLNKKQIDFDRKIREITRIQSSASFQISKLISESLRKPMKIPMLPFSILRLLFNIVSQRKGKIGNISHRRGINSQLKPRNCIVLFPTNGVGFGHFTRLLSVARSLKKNSPETEIVFFTTMPTLHVLADEGIVAYHMPGRYRYGDMSASDWNGICEEMLTLIFTIHRPKAFIFDGAFPYRGMLNSLKTNSQGILKIWLRRGAIKKSSKSIPVDSIGHFNAIIRPGDSVSDEFSEETKHNIPILRTNPIILVSDGLKEEGIRGRMGIPPEALLGYVQLGAGRINDITSELGITLDYLDRQDGVYSIVGESMLGGRISSNHEKVRILRDYPNSRYFNEFDFAIIAGGYNSFHEVLSHSLPTVCFPNHSTGRDDQYSRALEASNLGKMIVVKNRTVENIGIAISRILDYEVRESMRDKMATSLTKNGSDEVAEWLLEQISS